MLKRCYNPRHKSYSSYGGRGISVCDSWNKYENFKEWAISNGYSEGLSIERVDVNGDYCPENCKWVPMSEQHLNKRPFSGKHRGFGLKLTLEKVVNIKKMIANGEPCKKIASMYNISLGLVYFIKNGRAWADVTI